MSAALRDPRDRGGPAQPLLRVDRLTKHFPVRGDLFSKRKTVRAVDAVSFAIAKGETVGIVGESGCGKSTTARLLMRLVEPDAGSIVFDGVEMSSLGARAHVPNLSAYTSTKGAIDTLVKQFAAELGPRGIRVNAVAPGVIETDMSSFAKTDAGRDFTLSLQALKRIG